jgi:hypothetical protein
MTLLSINNKKYSVMDIAEILLKVALNTKNQSNQSYIYQYV